MKEKREEWFAAACDGRATDEQIDALQRTIRQDPEALDEYLRYADLHAALVDDCVALDSGQIVSFPGPKRSSRKNFVPLLTGIAAGLAAALVVMVGTGWFVEPGIGRENDFVAVVTQAEGALWEGEDASIIVGSALRPGLLELCEGRVELELDSGARVALQGASRFELTNESRGVLHEGRLAASVPPHGIGFTVETTAMDIVDLGSQFALNVRNDGDIDVHVFEGEVEAILAEDPTPGHKEWIGPHGTRRLAKDGRDLEVRGFDALEFAPPPKLASGVREVHGDIRALQMAPPTVAQGTFQHNYILLFLEQPHVELEDPLEVSVFEPGQHLVGFTQEDGKNFRKKLEVGVRVDSFMLHFDAESPEWTRCRGTVTFDRPIVAVIAGGEQLSGTDELLGNWFTTYDRPDVKARQLEHDLVTISADRKRLTVDWGVGPAADQIRVLVEARDAYALR